jgi:hypothetical protein
VSVTVGVIIGLALLAGGGAGIAWGVSHLRDDPEQQATFDVRGRWLEVRTALVMSAFVVFLGLVFILGR